MKIRDLAVQLQQNVSHNQFDSNNKIHRSQSALDVDDSVISNN